MSDSSHVEKGAEIHTSSPEKLESLSPDNLSLVSQESTGLPRKNGSETFARLRYQYASVYRKIFTAIFITNLSVIVWLVVVNKGIPPSTAVGNASSANLMVCILFRQEEFVNLLYEIFTCVPHSTPLWIRTRLAKVFHYGGFHSGAGTSATVWYWLYTALVMKEYIDLPRFDVLANVVMSLILVLMLVIILASAHPNIRRRYHNQFEVSHRFASWIALFSFWGQNVVAAAVVAKNTQQTISYVLVRSPKFWFICITTLCTILSWSRLRRRQVYPERLSSHATRLHFKHTKIQPFYGVKLSDTPASEWHAFAAIPEVDGKTGEINGFSVLVGNAGDWTDKQINQTEQRKLWLRGAPLHGLLYSSRLFKKIVVVATGSGIGPCLSLMFANVTPGRVLWSTRDPETTYGEGVINAVEKYDPTAVIWNTTTRGYPNIVKETYKLVCEANAEAVFVIANPKATLKVVFGMQSIGIPAYGAIFDS